VQVEEEETDEEDFVFDLFSDESPANIGFGFEQRAATGAAISPLGMSIGSGIVDLREDLAELRTAMADTVSGAEAVTPRSDVQSVALSMAAMEERLDRLEAMQVCILDEVRAISIQQKDAAPIAERYDISNDDDDLAEEEFFPRNAASEDLVALQTFLFIEPLVEVVQSGSTGGEREAQASDGFAPTIGASVEYESPKARPPADPGTEQAPRASHPEVWQSRTGRPAWADVEDEEPAAPTVWVAQPVAEGKPPRQVWKHGRRRALGPETRATAHR